MNNKPILTREQFYRKTDEFNNMPKENRLAGMKFSLECEHVRELLDYAWKFAKETTEKAGKTDIQYIYVSFHDSVIKTMLETAGFPPPIIPSVSRMLFMSRTINGLIWHVFTEIAPEEDVVLLTGNFDIYSEASNG